MQQSVLPLISCKDPNFAQLFVESLRDFGFGALVDHPLDMPRVRTIYEEWRHYFSAGVDKTYAMDPVQQDGYFSLQVAEHAKGSCQRDFKEYFQYYSWGRCPPKLQEHLAAHFDQAINFASELLAHIEREAPPAAMVNLSEPLSGMIAGSRQSMLRVLHYPPMSQGMSAPRAAPHEDINLLTLLPAADGPGLEIRARNGEWIKAPNQPEQLLVNIGDMLQEVLGGWLPSTTHRVVHSPDSASYGRMSLPLFLHPRPEVKLSARYTAASYLQERLGELGVLPAPTD
ncbi:isopenicillin N synthase family oxygenase [Luminiphilus sp.]|nr:isopenicillin N synthase family oxygenase [Luminiphilus sp.]